MPLDDSKILKRWLKDTSVVPKKSLGQHFLVSPTAIDEFIDLLNPITVTTKTRIIEIGPGPGILTSALLNRGYKVTAIEIDETLADQLRRLDPKGDRLTILPKNALEIDWPTWLQTQLTKNEKAIIVSNLPYYRSSAFLMNLLPLGEWISHLLLMVQREFAIRLNAPADHPKRSPLSIVREHYSELEGYFDIPPSSFIPPPKIISRMIKLRLKGSPTLTENLRYVIEKAFLKRRKTLRASLAFSSPKDRPILNKRPQELTYHEWCDVASLYPIIEGTGPIF